MAAPAGYPSQGEAAVADYLMRRRIPFEYEPEINGRYPDFLAHAASGDVVLEVYEPRLRLPSNVGSFDVVGPVLGAFDDRKRKQARAARQSDLPFVVVVGSHNSDIHYDDFAAVGALRGRPGIALAVGPGASGDFDPQPALIPPGKTSAKANTSYSAIAVIERFNPTQWRLELARRELASAALGSVLPDDHDKRIRALVEISDLYDRIEADLTKRGVYRPEVMLPRLRIFHNPDAAIPLHRSFGGVHDDQWGALTMPNGREGYARVPQLVGRR